MKDDNMTIEQWENQQEKLRQAEALVNDLVKVAGTYDRSHPEFIEKMRVQHRTHQQDVTRMMVEWLAFCASDEYGYDGRNQATHELAKEIQSKLDYPLTTYLPRI